MIETNGSQELQFVIVMDAAAEGGRAAGSLARARSQAAASSGGTRGATAPGGAGRAWTWAMARAGPESPANGGRPASSSYSRTPRA